MADDRKKISFGFSKKTTSSSVPVKKTEDRDYIESLEGKEIKSIISKKEEKIELIIPLKDSVPKWQKKLLKQKEIAMKNESQENKPESLDDIAARELINDAKAALEDKEEVRDIYSIPLNQNESEEEEDRDEPTINDYEKIPVADFGLAMLRGMGWEPGKGIGKNPKVVVAKEPTIRPRGMGLGADVPKPTMKQGQEDLKLCKGAYVKIIQGPLKGCYAKVEGFDDSCGRIVVRMALGGKTQSICEYMVQLVTSKEYREKSKEINKDNAELIKRSANFAPNNNSSNNINSSSKEYGLIKKHKHKKHRSRSRSPSHSHHRRR